MTAVATPLTHLDRQTRGPLGPVSVKHFACPKGAVDTILAASFVPGTSLTGTATSAARRLVSVRVEEQQPKSDHTALIVATYVGWRRYASTTGLDAYELSTRVYTDRWGRSGGVRTFAVLAEDIDSYWTATAINTLWPSSYAAWVASAAYTAGTIRSYSGLHYLCLVTHTGVATVPSADATNWRVTAQLFEKRIESRTVENQMPGYPGWARITCHYQSPTLRRLAEETANRGVIYVDVSAEGEKVVEDLDAAVVEGWHKTFDTYRWHIATGSNIVLKPKCALRMHVAQDDPSLSTYMGLVGKVNDATALSNFGGAAAGTLLFLGAKMASTLDQSSDLWIADLYFVYDADGWNSKLTSQLWEVVPVPLEDEDGVIHVDLGLKPVGSPVARRIFAAGNFSTIDALATGY